MKKSILAAAFASAMLAVPAIVAGVGFERAASAPAKSQQKAAVFSVDLPLEMALTQDDISYFTIIDANADGQKWRYQAGGLTSPAAFKVDNDDWAITPGLRFEDVSSNYEMAFTLQQNMAGASWQSTFEFYIGTAPTAEAMTTLIGKIEGFYVAKKDTPYEQAIQFAVPGSAGTYYIGIHCVSPMETKDVSPWPATFKNLSVKAMASSAAAPMQPADITVTPAEAGGLSATVAFTMPSTAMNGQPLPAKELTATITSPADTKVVKAMPGAPVSQSVATNQGDNAISVKVDGDLEGEPVPLTVYTGVVLPMRVHDLAATLTPDNMSMTITWTPPTEGKDGGYVDFANLDYIVYLNDGPDGDYRELATVSGELTYTYTMEPGAKLRTTKLKVLSRNAAGVSQDETAWIDQDPVYVSEMLGTPYALPAIERFDNLDMKYTPLTIQRPDGYSGRWMISDPSGCVPDDNQSALMAYSPFDEGSTMGRVSLPKFSTKGLGNVAFTIKAMRYASYASNMDVYARDYDSEDLVHLGTINCSSATDWMEVTYPLPARFQGKEWVQFVIDVELADVDYVYAIDSYQVAVSAATDLAVLEITSADPLVAGTAAKFSARVANLGFNAVAPKVRFTATAPDGTALASQEVAVESIPLGTEKSVDWMFTPPTEQIDAELTIKAELVSGDEVPSNDVASAVCHVRRPELPVVTTLGADSRDGGVILSWQEPVLNKTLTESFEQLDDFYYGTEMGAFTAYDGDGKSVYKFANQVMPNEQLPKAFLVVNANRVGEGLEAATGDKYLLATCPEIIGDVKPDPANDWLISPVTEGGSYMSFYLNIISETYPETVRVMSSSTTADPAAFTEVSTILKQKFGWQKYEFRLPADAKYFAINYVSHDMFGVMIDDVTFVSAADQHTVESYNVYRDGVKLATTTDREYFDATAQTGTRYTYHVTTLTPSESIRSNAAVIVAGESSVEGATAVSGRAVAVPGGILVEGASSVSVHSVSGVALFSGDLGGSSVEIPLRPGIYLVTLDGHTVKLPVK